MSKAFLVFPDATERGVQSEALSNQGDVYFSRSFEEVAIARPSDEEIAMLEERGVQVLPGVQYEPLAADPFDVVYQPLQHHPKNLNDVLAHINARQAHQTSRGQDVHIAVVDTGVCGNMAEYPPWKRSPHSWSYSGSPWTDLRGHGSMVACAATATTASGGRYDGVAPDATLISCKTSFDSTELYQIYDHLLQLIDDGSIDRLVINNSFGRYTCSPPATDPSNDQFIRIVRRAESRGVVPVFAAGNNHVKVCGHDPSQCGPNSIWGANSLDEVMSVGTVDENNRMDQPPATPGGYCHRDSSRGQGQLAQATTKPDCVAPTYGEIMWGCGYTAMQWWGTSGAAPQVAGLAALLLSADRSLTSSQVKDIIKTTCTSLPMAEECSGSGLIDCQAAVSHVIGGP